MFDQIFDTMRKATEMNVQMQQEMFRRWSALWPGVPGAPGQPAPASWGEQLQGFSRKWAETVNELVKRQQETQQAQFAAGLKQIEQAFQLAEVKDVNALREKTMELWRTTFQLLQQASEAQVRDFQAALSKWAELIYPRPA
jgi:hypothetical protein